MAGRMLAESDGPLPLMTVPTIEFRKENGVVWSSSPGVSKSGSDIVSKREVIHKLRLQLKRRDIMILEMQDQIVELPNSVKAQVTNTFHLQSHTA